MAKRAIEERRVEQQYWVIKTTEGGPSYTDHWKDFQAEKVVGLGWSDIEDDPTKFSNYQEFFEYLDSKYDWNVHHAARTIYTFARKWQVGDIALICRGYSPNQKKDVYLYGRALITGKYFYDHNSEWWAHKRKAKIRPIERYIPLNIFVDTFGGAMLSTVHGPFSEEQFREFSKEVKGLYPELWKEPFTENEPVAVDVSEPPRRISVTTARIVRDTATAKQLKVSYEYRCQVCGERIEISDRRFYAEVHHIRPLGGEHNGYDEVENMLILCPNHHAMFDFGIPRFLSTERIKIHQEYFSLTRKHQLGKHNVDYYNTTIYKAG